MEWRYFRSREVREARAFAAQGGIAIHENIYRLRGMATAHMLGPDEATLLEAGRELGLTARNFHRSNTLHFDLVGDRLALAIRRCGLKPEDR